MKKKIPFLAIILVSFSILTAFNQTKQDTGYEIQKNPSFKNLKVLPKDISDEALEGTMQSFNAALGVNAVSVMPPELTTNWILPAMPIRIKIPRER